VSDGLHRRGKIWHFRYRAADGREREMSTRTANYQEARKTQAEKLAEVREGLLPTDRARWTLTQAAKEWLELRAHQVSAATLKLNAGQAKPLLAAMGALRLEEIARDPYRLRRYQQQRLKSVKPRTVNLELQVLRGILKDARLWRLLEDDYKPLRSPKSLRGRALSAEEEARLWAAAALKPAWSTANLAARLMAATGMRGKEVKNLRRVDIELEQRRVRIRRDATKTDAGERIAKLNVSAMWALARLLERQESIARDLCGTAPVPEHYLLPANLSRYTQGPETGSRGFALDRPQKSFRSAWRKLTEAAGLAGLRPHDLRHTFITAQAELGTPLEVVRAQVGHMGTEMTRYYVHISESAMTAAVDRLEQVRPQGLPPMKKAASAAVH
jgi:integrase